MALQSNQGENNMAMIYQPQTNSNRSVELIEELSRNVQDGNSIIDHLSCSERTIHNGETQMIVERIYTVKVISVKEKR